VVVANVEAAAYAVGVEAVAGLGLDVDVEAATSAVGLESICWARCRCRRRGCHVHSWT